MACVFLAIEVSADESCDMLAGTDVAAARVVPLPLDAGTAYMMIVLLDPSIEVVNVAVEPSADNVKPGVRGCVSRDERSDCWKRI